MTLIKGWDFESLAIPPDFEAPTIIQLHDFLAKQSIMDCELIIPFEGGPHPKSLAVWFGDRHHCRMFSLTDGDSPHAPGYSKGAFIHYVALTLDTPFSEVLSACRAIDTKPSGGPA